MAETWNRGGIVRAGLALGAALMLASPAAAQRVLSEGVKDLADQIVASVAKEQKRKIAVVPFRELDNQATVLGTFLAEELTTRLFGAGGLEIVERTMLDKIMAELKLGSSGAIDPETAKQIGKLAGVDAIVTGSVTDLQSSVAVNCRLLDVQTGRIFAAAQTRIVKDDDLRAVLGKTLGRGAGGTPPSSSPAPSAGGSAGATFDTESYRMSIESLRKARDGSRVRLVVVFENLGEQDLLLFFGPPQLLDESGQVWSYYTFDENTLRNELIKERAGYDGTVVPARQKIRVNIDFRDGGSGGNVFTLTWTEIKPKSGRRILFHDLRAQ